MKIKLILFIYFSTLLFSSSLFAENKTLQCMEAMKSIKFALQGVSENNLAFSLKNNDETRYMLFVSKHDKNNTAQTWRLLERQSDTLTYCLIGAGSSIELLADVSKMKTSEKYGLPGSGHKRCTEESDGMLAPLKIRAWANKELGKSYIQHLNSELGNYSFTLIQNTEGQGGKYPWILLNNTKDSLHPICYYDRGSDVNIQKNFQLAKKFNYKVPKIKGIK